MSRDSRVQNDLMIFFILGGRGYRLCRYATRVRAIWRRATPPDTPSRLTYVPRATLRVHTARLASRVTWILDNSDDNFQTAMPKIVVFFGFR